MPSGSVFIVLNNSLPGSRLHGHMESINVRRENRKIMKREIQIYGLFISRALSTFVPVIGLVQTSRESACVSTWELARVFYH